MRFCVDASAVVAWLIPEQRTNEIGSFWTSLSEEDELVAPSLLYPECSSVLRVKAWQGLLQHDEAMHLTSEMLRIPLRLSHLTEQFPRAMEIAERTKRKKSYDMQYVAVAELEGCEMVTLDRGIYQASIERKIPARLLR